MTTRRNAVAAIIAAPVVALTDEVRNDQKPRLELSPEALERISEILEKGGKICSLSYSLPAPPGRWASGTAFLVKEEERDWRIVK